MLLAEIWTQALFKSQSKYNQRQGRKSSSDRQNFNFERSEHSANNNVFISVRLEITKQAI